MGAVPTEEDRPGKWTRKEYQHAAAEIKVNSNKMKMSGPFIGVFGLFLEGSFFSFDGERGLFIRVRECLVLFPFAISL